MVELLFLPSKTPRSRHKTTKDIELEDQLAKSHAAAFSHHRAGRGKAGKVQLLAHSNSCYRTCGAFYMPNKILQQEKIQMQQGWSLNMNMLHVNALDPLFPLPFDLELDERCLLHIYLQATPRKVYGITTQNPVYCPVRDTVVPEIAANALFLRWILYLVTASSGPSGKTALIRRADIYKDMIQLLETPGEAERDSTLMVLLAAGIAENRMGNLKLASTHYTGALGLLRNFRGGLRAIQRMNFVTGMGVVNGVLMQDVPLFETWRAVLEALMRIEMPQATAIADKRLWDFFGAETEMMAQREIAFHVANLHMMCLMLEHGAPDSTGFVSELARMTLGSGPSLSPSAITFMICASAVSIGQWAGDKPALRCWESIEFARLMMFTPTVRKVVVQAMSAMLQGREPPKVKLMDSVLEIDDGWHAMNFKSRLPR